MRTLTRTLAAVGLASALALVALPAGASQESDAGAAIQKYMKAAFAGEWAKAYKMLPTAQSELLTVDDWTACETERNGRLVGAELEKFDVVKSKKERLTIPGTDEKSPALAVTIKVTASLDGQSNTETDVVHVVKQGKSWRPSVSEDHIQFCLSSA